MNLFNSSAKNKKDSTADDKDQLLNIKQIQCDLSKFYNISSNIHDSTLEAFDAFNNIIESTKRNKDIINNENIVKSFLEENSKYSFRLRVFLDDMSKVITRLSLDEVSGLQIKKLCYQHLTNLLTSKQFEDKRTNESKIISIETYRYGGDEFVIVIERNIGIEVIFIDLMYLNYFNEIGGHLGGDCAICASSRIIEKTLNEFSDKTIKTKDIIDKLISNFNEFRFGSDFGALNKILFHIDTGYANDGELNDIEDKFKKEIDNYNKTNKQQIEFSGLTIAEKREILVELADIRSNYKKKVSKIFFLLNLYKRSKDDKKIKEIFDGYSSFTKKMEVIKTLITKILASSNDENEQYRKIAESTQKSIIKTYKTIILNKGSQRAKLLYTVVLSQATKNLSKKKPEININDLINRWGID